MYLDVRGKKASVEEVEVESAEDGMLGSNLRVDYRADRIRYHYRQEEQVEEGYHCCYTKYTYRSDPNKPLCRLDY